MKHLYAVYSLWKFEGNTLTKWVLRGYGVMSPKEATKMNNRVAELDREEACKGRFGPSASMSYQVRRIEVKAKVK